MYCCVKDLPLAQRENNSTDCVTTYPPSFLPGSILSTVFLNLLDPLLATVFETPSLGVPALVADYASI